MKKLMIFLMVMAAFGFCSSATADTVLYANYDSSTHILSIDYVGARLRTWACDDVQAVQFDRLVLDDDGRPQIYLEFYGIINADPVRLWVERLPGSHRIAFWGRTGGIPCGTRFQIRFLTWVNNQETWLYWPIGPAGPGEPIQGEPTIAEFHGLNVEVDYEGGVFRTICP